MDVYNFKSFHPTISYVGYKSRSICRGLASENGDDFQVLCARESWLNSQCERLIYTWKSDPYL